VPLTISGQPVINAGVAVKRHRGDLALIRAEEHLVAGLPLTRHAREKVHALGPVFATRRNNVFARTVLYHCTHQTKSSVRINLGDEHAFT